MTKSQILRQAAEADNVRRYVTRNYLDGNVRWKMKRSDIGPFLLRVNKSIDGWYAQEMKEESLPDGSFAQSGGDILCRGWDTANQAIRAGLEALAERSMTRAETLQYVADRPNVLAYVTVKDGHVYLRALTSPRIDEQEPLFGLVHFPGTGSWRWCSYPAGVVNPQGHDTPEQAIRAGLVIAAEKEELKNVNRG